jgi:phage gpG-like protein
VDDIVFRLDTDDAEAFFDYAGYKARNLTEPLNRAADTISAAIMDAFITEGASTGRPWAQLSKSRVGERRGLEHPILRWTDDLFDAATGADAFSIGHTGPYSAALRYHVDLDYAAAQQKGGWVDAGGNQHPPARPFVVFTAAVQREVQDHFREWLDDLRDRNRRRADRPVSFPFIPGLSEL